MQQCVTTGAEGSAQRIPQASFTDCGIDPTVNRIDQT